MFSGIYTITNNINNKIYIGSSKDIFKRWNNHLYDLFNGMHHSYLLQSDFEKYKLEDFRFEIIQLMEQNDDLLKQEQYWINYYDSCNEEKGYNVNPFTKLKYINESIYQNLEIDFVDSIDLRIKTIIKNNIIIYNGNLCRMGNDETSFSKSWILKRTQTDLNKIKVTLKNYCQNISKSKGKERYWTTFRSFQGKLSGDGYTKCFIPINTEEIKDKRRIGIFLCNCYLNSFYLNKLNGNKKDINNKYALSVLLKWMTNVLNINNKFTLFIPSIRMRNILIDWINS